MNHLNWKKCTELIIGGTGLLSKRPTRYANKGWPTFFKTASGTRVKALDGKEYLDMSEFSIGCNPEGYGSIVDRLFIIKYLFSSPLSTLISPFEFKTASLLNKVLGVKYRWKFARGGGETATQAIRIGRAHQQGRKDGPIIVMGYHGWHDWYLSANLKTTSALDKVFLEGLNPEGVPKALEDSVIPVDASSKELKKMVEEINPSIIIYEPARYSLLGDNVVKLLREQQDEGCILIADEITTGFRSEKIIASKEIMLDPDILLLGKALGNGFAI